jgi:tRNA 2-selenouridine synthase SelU
LPTRALWLLHTATFIGCQKRLGLERYQALLKKVNTALSMYQEQDEIKGFYPVIKALLVNHRH